MSQRAALAALDARLHAAFARAGLAGFAVYTLPAPPPSDDPDNDPPPPAPVPDVPVYVDAEARVYGQYGEVIATRTEITFADDSVTPVRLATVAVDGTTYRLEAPVGDTTLPRWVVQAVTP